MNWLRDGRRWINILDPICWAAAIGLFVMFEISWEWLLALVPLWLAFRIWYIIRRMRNEGL